tara:strand:+ start:105 stop:269 length:165 start_codon:yes stop_codon:yes gene_type:complete
VVPVKPIYLRIRKALRMQGFFIGASSKLLTWSKDERPVKTSLSPNQPKKSKTQI